MQVCRFLMLVVTVLAIMIPGVGVAPARAIDPGEALADAALEKRARALSLELRCLVCQNQSIDDSDAPLARDLRQFVRTRLLAGDPDAAIRDGVVQRYGEFVLFRPVVATHTIALWATPVLILLAGFVWGWRLMRRTSLTPPQ